MSVQELALQRNKYKHLSDEEWRWFLEQVEGRERTADKLPTFAAIEDWWYPVRLSCEQCSSEQTARYKASLARGETMADLTAGYGVDTYFLSEHFAHTDYVEKDAELCRIAMHNFAGKPISIHNTTAEEFLASAGQYDLIFADPARRDNYGGKVFKLEDCTPNVVELLPTLLSHGKRLMLKLSPMLDISQAVTSLSQVSWDVHVVAVKNEVKEVLLLSGGTGTITAIDLAKKEQAFTFTKEEEKDAECQIVNGTCPNGTWLYEPNAAILKAGAYKLVAARYGLQKLDVNTHLYASDKQLEDFPGRVWKIKANSEKPEANGQANVLTRNYPLTPEQLKKKLHLRDGGTVYVIGCRVNGKPTLFYAERV
ncbi:MAG: SAM-dependent methyltransferase [Paludibacteraceae bacterium]|nr:SAM-dependent methyltransferase [Paludibacteraceae bacterium]